MKELTSTIPILIRLKREYRIKCKRFKELGYSDFECRARKPKITAIKIILKTKNYIKMCEKAPQLWEDMEHDGSLIAWRSFIGVVHKCKKRKKFEGLSAFVPETLVIRTWLKDDEDIMILKTNIDYGGSDPDRGTPIYTQEQLQDMITTQGYFRFSLIELFYRFTNKQDFTKIKSMNEVWLAFVMHEKYNKIWTGKDWELEK